jgi:hypothetical protein
MENRLVTLSYLGKKLALPNVEVSPASAGEKNMREENELWAIFAIHDAMPIVRRAFPEMDVREVYLRVVTEVVRAQYGHRDEPAEHETSVRYFRHYGFEEFGDEFKRLQR